MIAVLDRLCRLMTWIGAVALVVMMLGTVADVILRAVANLPLRGTVDLVEAMLVLVVFLGLPESFLRQEQITVDIFDHVVSARTLRGFRVTAAAASLGFLALLAVYVVRPMLDALEFGDRKPDLPIPIFPLMLVIEISIVVSLVAMALITFREFVREARA
jgi:TRAP-type C4-dicarboxylate transport system permease small subunit